MEQSLIEREVMQEANDDQDQVQPGVVLELASTKVRCFKHHSQRTQVRKQRGNKAWHQRARPDTLSLPKALKTTSSMMSESIESE